jgi:tetratricopeptide (TPR) repeat protein
MSLPFSPERLAHPPDRRPWHRALPFFLLVLLAVSTEAQDPAAERLFLEAERLAGAGEVDAAVQEYLLLAQQFPSDALRPRALLAVARIRDAAGDVHGAEDVLQKVLADHPRTPEAAEAFFLQGQLQTLEARLESDLEAARTTLRRIPLLYGAESFPDLPVRARARVRSAEIGLALGDLDTAASELVAVIEEEPAGGIGGRARRLYAETLLRQGETAAAVDVLNRLAEGRADDGAPVELPEADRARARRLLTLIHRHLLSPQAGDQRYRTAERFPHGATLERPSAVAAAEDGHSLVVDERTDSLLLLDAEGTVIERRALEKAGRPGWLDDTAYAVADEQIQLPFEGRRISFLEPRSGREVTLDDLRAAERGLFGHWYVLAKGWRSVLVYEGARKGSELLAKDRPDFEDIARDRQGRILVLDDRGKRVSRIDHDRRFGGAVVQGSWRRPAALAVDALGQIYVLDRGEKTVSIYSEDGKRLASLGPALPGGITLGSPEDLSVDGSGRLFIADSDLSFLVVLD